MKKQAKLFPETQVSILTGLALREAQTAADRIKTSVAVHCKRIEIGGSIQRQRNVVHDIDFVIVTKSNIEWQRISEELKRLKAKLNCQGNSVIKALFPIGNGFFRVDFYRAQPPTFGMHLLIRTGSAEHNMWLAAYAISKGMRLKYSEGLIKEGNSIAGETEEDVFEALGLPCPAPTQREIVDDKPVWMHSSQTT